MNTSQFKDKIKEHMPIVSSNDEQFGSVDHLEGDSVKVTKDASGQHHYFPLSWVTSVDEKVRVDRAGSQATQEWTTEPQTTPTPTR